MLLDVAPPRSPTRRGRASALIASMVLAIVAVTALAWWDARREAQASLDDFAEEQARLAEGDSRFGLGRPWKAGRISGVGVQKSA